MENNKQIEEMAELERLLRIRRMDIEKQGCDIWGFIKGATSEEQAIAEYLIGQNYRKASDVAREIFAEIEEKGKVDEPIVEYYILSYSELAELKKKYMEGEGCS